MALVSKSHGSVLRTKLIGQPMHRGEIQKQIKSLIILHCILPVIETDINDTLENYMNVAKTLSRQTLIESLVKLIIVSIVMALKRQIIYWLIEEILLTKGRPRGDFSMRKKDDVLDAILAVKTFLLYKYKKNIQQQGPNL